MRSRYTLCCIFVLVVAVSALVPELLPSRLIVPYGVDTVLYSSCWEDGPEWVEDTIIMAGDTVDSVGQKEYSFLVPNPMGGTKYWTTYDDSLCTGTYYGYNCADRYRNDYISYSYSGEGLLLSTKHRHQAGSRFPQSRFTHDTLTVKMYDEQGSNTGDSLYIKHTGYNPETDTLTVFNVYGSLGMLIEKVYRNGLDSIVQKKVYAPIWRVAFSFQETTLKPDSTGEMVAVSSMTLISSGSSVRIEKKDAKGVIREEIVMNFNSENKLEMMSRKEFSYDGTLDNGYRAKYRYEGAVSTVASKGVVASPSSLKVNAGVLVYRNSALQNASARYEIYSLTGRLVKGGVISGVETGLDCGYLAKGVYLMKVTLPNGGFDLMKVELQ